MAITEQQLAQGLEQLYDEYSDRTDIDPAEARKLFAQKQAKLFFQAMIGRETTVKGASATGGAVTGTGVIKE